MKPLLIPTVLMLLGCPFPIVDGECAVTWNWIDEESCLMDVCARQQPNGDILSECRQDGECWCCNEDKCWFSGQTYLSTDDRESE